MGGRTSPRKRGERSATGKDRGNDRGGGGDTGDADKHPECLAQIDDVEKPAQENAKDCECGDHDSERASQSIDNALQ